MKNEVSRLCLAHRVTKFFEIQQRGQLEYELSKKHEAFLKEQVE